MSNNKLAVLGDIERRLAAVRTVDEAKSIRDQAEAIRVYAKSARKGLEIQNHAAFVKIQAERRAGELLAAVERSNGGGHKRSTVSLTQVLEANDIPEPTGRRWQMMAKATEAEVRQLAAAATEAESELSSAAVYRMGRGESVHFSSTTDNWETPAELFRVLDAEFGFTLDVCATKGNAKARDFFTPEDDGLAHDWRGVCWMNPPYGDVIPSWIEKAFTSARDGATVVCLVPARVDTAWWWDFCRFGEIRFLRGRLKFGGQQNSAPFPSAVVVFPRQPKVVWWEWQTD